MSNSKEVIQEGSPAPQSSSAEWMPIRRFAAEHQQKKLWMGAAIACAFLAIIGPLIVIAQFRSQPLVFAVDGSKTIHVGRLEILDSESDVFTTTVLNAVQVALQRSPAGFSLQEMVPLIYREDAAKKLKDDLQNQMPDITARNIHQWPEVKTIKIVKETNGVRVFAAQCVVYRKGVFEGAPIEDKPTEVSMICAVVPNPRVGRRGQFPFVVSDWRIRAKAPTESETAQP